MMKCFEASGFTCFSTPTNSINCVTVKMKPGRRHKFIWFWINVIVLFLSNYVACDNLGKMKTLYYFSSKKYSKELRALEIHIFSQILGEETHFKEQ